MGLARGLEVTSWESFSPTNIPYDMGNVSSGVDGVDHAAEDALVVSNLFAPFFHDEDRGSEDCFD